MTSRNYNGKIASIKLDVNMDSISRSLSDYQVITLSFNKAVEETFIQEALGKKIINMMKRLIRSGGSAKYPWGFWSRTKGSGKQFSYHRGRPAKWSNSMRYSSSGTGNTINIPVSPRTFYVRRRMRKRPVAGQFALQDTGMMLSGIYFTNTKLKYGKVYQMITNAHLRNAEYGQNNQPTRKVMLPVYEQVMMMDKSKIEASIILKMTNDIKRLNKDL